MADRRLLELSGIEVPIVQAPMAGAQGAALAGAVSEAGGLGSLPCSLLDAEAMHAELAAVRAVSSRPVNVNFFCHDDHPVGGAEAAWRDVLAPYYAELGLADATPYDVAIVPFDDARCQVVEELRPEVVSFHFGLPADDLLDRVRATGPGSSPRRRRCPRPSGWRTTAATRSSPKAPRRAGTGACS